MSKTIYLAKWTGHQKGELVYTAFRKEYDALQYQLSFMGGYGNVEIKRILLL